MKTAQMGEWQEERNQWGGVRRFRMVGGIKEYEMVVSVDGMQIPESELEDYHRRKKEREAAAAEAHKAAPRPAHIARPFNGGSHSCTREKCALYTGDGCTLARIAVSGATDTAGKSCPFSPYMVSVFNRAADDNDLFLATVSRWEQLTADTVERF